MKRIIPIVVLCALALSSSPEAAFAEKKYGLGCEEGTACVSYSLATCEDKGDPISYDCDGKLRTPEDRAALKRAAEVAAAQQAAEEAKKAMFEAKVAAQVEKMGAHRASEARRFAEMQQRAAAALGETASTPENCKKEHKTGLIGNGNRPTKADALARLQTEDGRYQCPGGLGGYTLVSAPVCTSSTYGLTDAQKRHLAAAGIRASTEEMKVYWGCSARYRCRQPQTICKPGAAGGSEQ